MSSPELSALERSTAAAHMLQLNRNFYDALWSDARLIEPQRFNTWPLVQALVPPASRCLEVAPGLRPRLPLIGTEFIDISVPAVRALRKMGASAVIGQVTALPFANAAFEFVCAFDIVEHVEDEDAAFGELARVAEPGAALLLSVPLHPEQWNAFDDFVGHRRRYEPPHLIAKLAEHGFAIERSAVYGMQPESSRLLDLGMWFLTHRRQHAMWWYNHVLMPLGARFQKPLTVVSGLIDTKGVGEVLLVCRKKTQPA